MLTFRKIAAAGNGKILSRYLRETANIANQHRKLSQYYGGWDAKGTWRRDTDPELARALGIDLTTPPTDEALEHLFEARRANDGERWTKKKRQISTVDIHAAPHKSVTLAAVLAESQAERSAVLQAIWRANDYAMHAFAGRLAVARVGTNGKDGHMPGSVSWCSFMHFTARPTIARQDGAEGTTEVTTIDVPSDPQIHIHNPWFNLLLCEDGELRAMNFGRLKHIKEFGGIFQAQLAKELQAIGIATHYDHEEQAAVVDAIPDELSELFSKRRNAIIKLAKQNAHAEGLNWNDISSNKKQAYLNHAAAIREDKKQEQSDEERWVAEAKAAGFNHITSITNAPPVALSPQEWLDQTYEFTARHLADEFRTAAEIDLEALRRWAARSLIGAGIDAPNDVNRVVETVLKRGITIDGKHSEIIIGQISNKIRVSHSVQIAIEQRVQSLATAMGNDYGHALPAEALDAAIDRSGLSYEGDAGKEQLKAARSFVTGPALVYLEGIHGTGKTSRVLPPCVDLWQSLGYQVIGLCQAWRQTDDLGNAGIKELYALSPFLDGVRDGRIKVSRNTVLVLDEAAQVSARQFLELEQLWQKHGLMIRAMGDRLQCQAIEAASAAELISRDRVLPKNALPTLHETMRQSTPEERELATKFRKQETKEAIETKRDNGNARLVGGDYDQVVERVGDRYLALRTIAGENNWNRGVIIVTYTNDDAAAISRSVRQALQQRGAIAANETIYQAIDNRGNRYDLPIAIGDTVRLFKKTNGYIRGDRQHVGSNGDLVQILGHSDKGLTILTKTNEDAFVPWRYLTDPTNNRLKMGYGHCLTIDAAQGITSSVTIHAMPRGSSGATAFKAYVAESRHTEHCETMVSEAATRLAVQNARPMGDPRPITDDHLWDHIIRDLSDRPTKSLAIDLLRDVREDHEALLDDIHRLHHFLDTQNDPDYPEEIFGAVQNAEIEKATHPYATTLETRIRSRTKIFEDDMPEISNARAGFDNELIRELAERFDRPGLQPAI